MNEDRSVILSDHAKGLVYQGVRFLVSRRPIQVLVDGASIVVPPWSQGDTPEAENILLLPAPSVNQILNQPGNSEVRVYSEIRLPEAFPAPMVFEGRDCQVLQGKKVLVFTFNGWGDTILVQPVLRLFYEHVARSGDPPELTIAGSWISSFPYSDAPFISRVIPNHITLVNIRRYDAIINLACVTEYRGRRQSMRDLYLAALGIEEFRKNLHSPVISPDPGRVKRLRPLMERIRRQSGKGILYLNWRSRFNHKSAPASLFFEAAERLGSRYHAVLFKDQEEARIMGREIRTHQAPVENLSTWIRDLHDTVAALSLVDAVISVDTGIVHAAGALGVPGVAVFGPFSPANHVDAYPRIVGIRGVYKGETCSGPCGETHRGCAEVGFAADRFSPCIEAVTPEAIIKAMERECP
ncbi:MAG: glycosyltransferase family 9 protein [Syntrophales bacterium LBB04]|nr:glycosyltransferase family 9 protein [Syntrophales bacterium LBB04]